MKILIDIGHPAHVHLFKNYIFYLRANPALVVGDNTPYSAHDPRGYSMGTHGEDTGLPHVLFEIRQDLIDTHHGAESWANLLAVAIGQVVEEAQPFSVEHYER